jgi:hypothetical protein
MEMMFRTHCDWCCWYSFGGVCQYFTECVNRAAVVLACAAVNQSSVFLFELSVFSLLEVKCSFAVLEVKCYLSLSNGWDKVHDEDLCELFSSPDIRMSSSGAG